jgi:hypothetical protein
MSWCLQCGAEGRPTRASGVDEDGEPACVGHAVKEFGAGLNAAAGRAPAVPAPIKQPAAAPSPVQTKAEETTMRTCNCGCGGELKGRWPYLRGHNKQQGGATPVPKKPRKPKPSNAARIDRLVDHVNREIGVAQDVPLHLRVDRTQTSERLITLQFGESKVQKLLDLLLQ